MSALHTLSSRQHLVIAGLALMTLAAIIVLLFGVSPTAAASVLSALIILAVVALRAAMTAGATPRAPRAQPRPAAGEAEVGPPLLLTLADGETLVAREVDLGQPGEHRLLLTRKGYVLVNGAGEVIYRL